MRRFILVSLMIFMVSNVSFGRDYFISTAGSDRNEGRKKSPLKSIQRGLQFAKQPGDRVIVRKGIYPQSRTLNLYHRGTSKNWIELRAYENENVIIDGSDCPPKANLIAVGGHYIRIDGLTVRNATASGIAVWGQGRTVHDVHISNNTVHDCYLGGIFVGSRNMEDPARDILIENNTVHHTSMENKARARYSWAFACGAGISKNVIIRKNHVYESHGEGIGFYLAKNGLAEDNIVHDCFSVNIYLDNTTHTRVERNFVYSTMKSEFFRFKNPASGIQIANEKYPRYSQPSSHNTIVNNILVGNRYAFYYGNYQNGGGLKQTLFANNSCYGSTGSLLHIDSDAGHAGSRFVNNIFRERPGMRITDVDGPTTGIVFENNLWFGGVPTSKVRSLSDLMIDPLFVKEGGKRAEDYLLKPNSPVRGKGLRIDGIKTNFDGNPRSGRINIGAW